MGGEGFEPPAIHRGFRGVGSEAAQKAAHGWRGAIGEAGAPGRMGRGRLEWSSGGLGAAEGTRGDVAAHGAGGAGPAGGPRRGHGSSLAQAHALGPTEELTEAIEFVSGGCHRYRNLCTFIPAIECHEDRDTH